MDQRTEPRSGTVRVWSPLVRLFHWTLVGSVSVAWLASEGPRGLHEYAGYAAGVLVGWRIVAGIVGAPYTRFSQFVRGPGTVLSYMRSVLKGREHRYLGHNPAGGAMVLVLLATIAVTGATGWMMTTDTFWGVEWVEEVHEVTGNLILVLVGLHVAGVLLASVRHGENLVRSMVTGDKRPPAAGDVA